MNKEEMINQKFNHLTVVDFAYKEKGFEWYFCDCDCGTAKNYLVRKYSLLNGNTRSCGCLRKKKDGNYIYVLTRYNVVIVFYNKTDDFFAADLSDLSLIEANTWYPDDSKDKEPVTSIDGKKITFARLKLGLTGSKLVVDHINHDPRDSRSCNIRVCTKLQNLVNRKQAIGKIKEENGLFILRFPTESGEDDVFTFSTKAEAKAYKVQYLDENYFEFTPWHSAEIEKEHRLYYLDKTIGLHVIGSYASLLEEIKQLPERSIFKIVLRNIYSMIKDTGKFLHHEGDAYMLLTKLFDEYKAFKEEAA